MAHCILAPRCLLRRTHAAILRVADRVRNGCGILILSPACRRRRVDVLGFRR
jgi:hypothetical protein